jgi:hypothetical protein
MPDQRGTLYHSQRLWRVVPASEMLPANDYGITWLWKIHPVDHFPRKQPAGFPQGLGYGFDAIDWRVPGYLFHLPKRWGINQHSCICSGFGAEPIFGTPQFDEWDTKRRDTVTGTLNTWGIEQIGMTKGNSAEEQKQNTWSLG